MALSLPCGTSLGDNYTVGLGSTEKSNILGEMVSNFLKGVYSAREGALGPFSPNFDPSVWIRQGLERLVPEDAHLLV